MTKTNALRVSDQKCEAAINIDLFLFIFDKESLMHWLISYSYQIVLFEADILRYQFLHPWVTQAQYLKV
jgi:hypothetical protein